MLMLTPKDSKLLLLNPNSQSDWWLDTAAVGAEMRAVKRHFAVATEGNRKLIAGVAVAERIELKTG